MTEDTLPTVALRLVETAEGGVVLERGAERFELPQPLDAPTLDTLLRLLCDTRAGLDPPVPRDVPRIDDVSLHPAWRVRIDRHTRSALLSLRHLGFGWLHFELAMDDIGEMRRVWSEVARELGLDTSGGYNGPERRKPH